MSDAKKMTTDELVADVTAALPSIPPDPHDAHEPCPDCRAHHALNALRDRCNAHDELVEALKHRTEAACQSECDDERIHVCNDWKCGVSDHFTHMGVRYHRLPLTHTQECDEARAALRKAGVHE